MNAYGEAWLHMSRAGRCPAASHARRSAGARLTTYLCFIERDILGTPLIEPLTAENKDEALAQAEALLRNHASGIAAHILQDAVRVATIRARPDPDV